MGLVDTCEAGLRKKHKSQEWEKIGEATFVRGQFNVNFGISIGELQFGNSGDGCSG